MEGSTFIVFILSFCPISIRFIVEFGVLEESVDVVEDVVEFIPSCRLDSVSVAQDIAKRMNNAIRDPRGRFSDGRLDKYRVIGCINHKTLSWLIMATVKSHEQTGNTDDVTPV